MTVEEALAILERTLPPGSLNAVKTLVFRHAWEGKGYADIAEGAGYDPDYIKSTAAGLWHSLSEVLGQKVTKRNFRALMIQKCSSSPSILTEQPLPTYNSLGNGQKAATPSIFSQNGSSTPTHHQVNLIVQNRYDWGEAPDVSVFYGRSTELTQLQHDILDKGVRLVAILGMGGMGKTAFAVKTLENLSGKFDTIIWRSLRYAPSLETILTQLCTFLSDGQLTSGEIADLLRLCRTSRCLIVLDNLETILQPGNTGQYRPGYEGYGELLRGIGETVHQSCLLLTSREKPPEIAAFEGTGQAVRSLVLKGSTEVALTLLASVKGSDQQKQQLSQLYGKSPLVLKIVATSIQTSFEGEVAEFMTHRSVVFNQIRRQLDPQFERLSDLEMTLIFWLAIDRGKTTLKQLHQDIVPPVSQASLLQALESLTWRSLINISAPTSTKKHSNQYTIEPIVTEYLTHCFTEQIAQELTTGELKRFITHALIKTTGDQELQEYQRQHILAHIAQGLRTTFSSSKALEEQLKTILERLRDQEKQGSGYGLGNWLNLCIWLQIDLTGYDFSHLTVWQADLQQVNLHGVNFAYADLTHSIFAQTIGEITTITYSRNGVFFATGNTVGEVHLWSNATYQQRLLSPRHRGSVHTLAWSPDSQILVSGSEDQTLSVWDVPAAQCRQILTGHDSSVNAVAWSSSGQILASGSADHTIRLWDLRKGRIYRVLEQESAVSAVAFSPDGKILVSAGVDAILKVWEVNTGECIKICSGHDSRINSIEFVPLHTPFGSSAEIETGSNTNGFEGEDWFTDVEVEQIFASASADQTIRLWDVPTGRCLQTWLGHSQSVEAIAFHPHEPILASGSVDQTVKLWNRYTGQCLKTFDQTPDSIQTVAFSPNGKILAISRTHGTLQLWDVQTGEYRETLKPLGVYQQMNITGVTGLTSEQISRIMALGAVNTTGE